MDYTVYTNWYNYMSSILNRLESSSGDRASVYSDQMQSEQSFLDIFQNMVSESRIEAPENLDAIFQEAAQLYHVPVELLKAVGKAESNFDASAVSAAGAQGVMQLMPATAASLGVEDPFDARSNILGGAKYLSQMLERYDGDVTLALAAYNAGSGNVDKYGGVPPFAETQNYVRKVTEYMGMNLTAGQGTADAGVQRSASSLLQNASGGYTQEMAQYMIEMMNLQLMSQVNTLTASLGSAEDSDRFW